ncbi:MAG: hypothetical protein KF824_04415 [Fimbriimonadaceae bacterium]|nr:MAG: hypothetical protein KF824_04415 [Fimbriimonadaceae bacterium]
MNDRLHPEGVERSQLAWVLTQARFVKVAVRIDQCLLCRNKSVNEAGLCDVCFTFLDDKETELALRWTSGVAP